MFLSLMGMDTQVSLGDPNFHGTPGGLVSSSRAYLSQSNRSEYPGGQLFHTMPRTLSSGAHSSSNSFCYRKGPCPSNNFTHTHIHTYPSHIHIYLKHPTHPHIPFTYPLNSLTHTPHNAPLITHPYTYQHPLNTLLHTQPLNKPPPSFKHTST